LTVPSTDPDVPERPTGRALRARDGVLVVAVALALLVLFEGSSVRSAGEEMDPGLERSVVLAVGAPTGWVADRLPFDDAADEALGWLSPDDDLGGGSGFDAPAGAPRGGAAAVSPDSFDPVELGAEAREPRPLRTLLVTGDSLAMPLDTELARRLAEDGDVRVVREPHVGTGISKTGLLDWGKLAKQQVGDLDPDAIVVFIGANEGFPLPGSDGRESQCCGPEWAAAYGSRVRTMMDTYRQGGDARVYWLALPLPRDRARQEIARSVNAAIDVAGEPFRAQVRVLDLVDTFTPGGGYRDAMEVDGRDQIVREADGIHLNGTGAEVAADLVLDALRRDFGE